METYTPSWFDRMLDRADKLIRQGFTFFSGEETPRFEETMHRMALARVRRESGFGD